MKKRLVEVTLVVAPKVLGGVLTVGFNAVLMRYLGPAEYGVFALCTAAILMYDGILGASVDNAMVKLVQAEVGRKSAHGLEIEQAALLFKLGLWLATAVLVAPFLGQISARWFHQDGRATLPLLVLLAVGALLMFRSLLAHWQVRERFALYGALDAAHIALKFGSLGVLLLLVTHPLTEWLVALLATAPAGVVLLAAASGAFPLIRPAASRARVAQVAKVSKWFLLTFGLSTMLNRLDVFLLTEFSDIVQVGIYSGGQAFAVIPELLGGYLGIVLMPRIYAYWQNGRLPALSRNVVCLGVSLSAVLLAGVWFGLPWIKLLFPSSFQPSAEVLLILLPGSLAAMIAFPLAIPFLMFARPRAIFMLDLLTLPLVVALYVWLIYNFGANGAAWAATLTRLAKVGAMHVLMFRALRQSPAPPDKKVVSV